MATGVVHTDTTMPPPPTSANPMATDGTHKGATTMLPPTSAAPMATGASHQGTTTLSPHTSVAPMATGAVCKRTTTLPPTSAAPMATGEAHKGTTTLPPPTSATPMATGAVHTDTTMPPDTPGTTLTKELCSIKTLEGGNGLLIKHSLNCTSDQSQPTSSGVSASPGKKKRKHSNEDIDGVVDYVQTKTPKKFRGSGQRLLSGLGVKFLKDLTPKASALYNHASSLKRNIMQMRRRTRRFRSRGSLAETFSKTNGLNDLINKTDKNTYNFICNQLLNCKCKPKGRCFTLEDKIFALSLFKQSPKGYKLLARYFSLPSKQVLRSLLGRLPFLPGINESIFNHLEKVVAGMPERDKFCVLMFDEVKLQAHVSYNEKLDLIEGFENYGLGDQRCKFADHALVFMLRGISGKWKQPVAFMLSEATTDTITLVKCIKDVISAVKKTGLKILATVCDQATTNEAAINYLKNETKEYCLWHNEENKYFGFLINGVEIIALFDPPHLLKGIRNNLLVKNLNFVWKKGKQLASWKHIEQFYDLDCVQDHDLRTCPKLTDDDEHVKISVIRKMKVSTCAQVLCQRVSSTMRMLATWGRDDCNLPKEAVDTADLLLFMDQLFDSINGVSIHPVKGKSLRCSVSDTSPHLKFWREAHSVLKSFVLIDSRGKHSTPPSVRNWITTLMGLVIVWGKLKAQGFRFMVPRVFYQDPLEDFFSSIRSHGIRNVMPTCTGFVSSFKSILINNFTTTHSIHANCADDTLGSLDTLKDFITGHVSHTITNSKPDCFYSILDIANDEMENTNSLSTATQAYVSGYLARKVFRKCKDCEICRNILFSNGPGPGSEVIEARVYTAKTSCYPNTAFSKIGLIVAKVVSQYLPILCNKANVKTSLLTVILTEFDMGLFTCSEHDLCKYVLDLALCLHIHNYCKIINRILIGKLTNVVIKGDCIKQAAQQKYRKTVKSKHLKK